MIPAQDLGPRQKRPISDVALTTTLAGLIQQATLEKMRRLSLGSLPRTHLFRQVTPPLSPTRIGKYVRESADQCTEFRSDLVEKAVGDVNQSIKYKKIDPSDLMCDDSFCGYNSADSRMDEWIKEANNLSRHEMEVKKGTPFEPIPEEQQRYSCFQYALTRLGIPIQEEAMQDFQSECLLDRMDSEMLGALHSHCRQVDAPAENDLVLFWANGHPSHLGIVQQGQILSKEGDWSQFAYRRRLEDLGVDYGDEVTFLRKITPLG